jgi:hypothetical protein
VRVLLQAVKILAEDFRELKEAVRVLVWAESVITKTIKVLVKVARVSGPVLLQSRKVWSSLVCFASIHFGLDSIAFSLILFNAAKFRTNLVPFKLLRPPTGQSTITNLNYSVNIIKTVHIRFQSRSIG